MCFEQMMTTYLKWMTMRNLSPRTVQQWRWQIQIFRRWCDQRGIETITEVTPEILASYRRYLFHYRNAKTGKPIKFATQAAYLHALKRWFAWLTEQQHLETDPALGLELPQEEERLPIDVLTADEVELIINGTDIKTMTGLRDRAMLEVFYSSGIRRRELVNLDVYDLKPDRKVLTIRQGKGNKDRVCPIGDRALSWVGRYLAEVRPELAWRHNDNAVFLSHRGRRLTPNLVSGLVRKYFLLAGIQNRGACHLLRHTAATLMMENGADLRSLQEYLGHKRLNTTQVYTHVSIKRLQQVHERTHPAKPNRKKRK